MRRRAFQAPSPETLLSPGSATLVACRPMRPWSFPLRGRLEEHEIESKLLQGNRLGDPHRRPLSVYVPPGYDETKDRRYATVYMIQGLTGQLDMWRNRAPFRKNFPELVDDLFAANEAPPCIVVYADCWTSLGGSQFLDSPGTGKYMSYLCDEVVPFVDARYRTVAKREHRGIAGKSSGGYGAMVVPMLRPEVFAGLATHAGDALFEVCYQPDFRKSVRALRDHYQGSFAKFWDDFRSRPALSKDSDHTLLNDYCMAACYSADADGTVRMPYDTATGELLPEVWARWLALDPVRMVKKHEGTMRSMKAIYIDAGKRDEWCLDLGAEAYRRALADIGVAPPSHEVFFELFDATHMSIEYRYPKSLAYLATKLAV